MASYAPYQVPYQNQLQFNLGVPLVTQNLAAHYHHPSPIVVERVGGQHAISSKITTQKLQGSPLRTDRSAANYSTLSEDKMEVMSQLARRDLKNKALQAQMASNSASVCTTSPALSPVRGRQRQPPAGRAQGIQFSRLQQQQQRRARHPLTAKESEKNRRFGAVQTPPPRRPGSHTRVGNDSVFLQRNASMDTTQETDIYFPVKPSLPLEAHTADEIAKLQQEMEGYLQFVEKIVDRAIAEGSTYFLHPPTRGKHKDGFLAEEEGYDRARARVGEQNTRSVRNLYNLRQKVKQLQRDSVQADLRKPAKKNQITAQLAVVHRGAAKAVHTFVNQLPYQDLTSGLPAHFHELALLLRQLTGLASLTKLGKPDGAEHGGLITLLEAIEANNANWCAQLKRAEPSCTTQRKETKKNKPAGSKGWVSDTKVDRDIFVTKDKPVQMLGMQLQPPKKVGTGQPGLAVKKKQQQRMSRPAKRPPGKENRKNVEQNIGRRDELRAGIAALLQSQNDGGDRPRGGGMTRDLPRPVAWEVDINKRPHKQDHRKGYLLPSDLIAKRERAQRAVEASNQQDWNFADPTVASRLKTSLRPSSAPPSPDKRVNFDLNHKPLAPWMPAGSGRTRSPASRSLSSERRSPFYLREMDGQDFREVFPDKHYLQTTKKTETEKPADYGFRSLPTDKKLRSADVSNSFIDAVEHRLLARMMGQQAGDGNMRGGQRPLIEHRSSSGLDLTADTTTDLFSETGFDDTLDTTSPGDAVQREAVSLLDAPTLENVKLRLREMQREQREIRQRWSTLKFYDSTAKSKIFSASERLSERPREPPAIELSRGSQRRQGQDTNWPVSKEVVEVPLIFTKPSLDTRSLQYLHTVYPGASSLAGRDIKEQVEREPDLTKTSLPRPARRLLSLKQTTAERIASDRARFESYLRRRSHHPAGKFDPWALMDEISDEILMDCLRDISEEVEGINEEIANHMYKSEFMVDHSRSPISPPHSVLQQIQRGAGPPQHHQISPQGSREIAPGGGGEARSRVVHQQLGTTASPRGGTVSGAAGDWRVPSLDTQTHYASGLQRQSLDRDTPPVTPRSPAGGQHRGSPLQGRSRGSSPVAGQAGGHLWRSSPGSVSPGRELRSRSASPRSPQVSFGGNAGGGMMSPTAARGRGGSPPSREGMSPTGRRAMSPQVSASEPLLQDVSQLLPNKAGSRGDTSEEEESRAASHENSEARRQVDRSGHGGEEGDDDDDEDDGDDDYSEEDFEEVTDVEL